MKINVTMVTVYTITYNEEVLIQFMIDHYRERFPGCRIVVNDNMSTDRTAQIALANDCEVIPFNTDTNYFQEQRLVEIRDSCWKNAQTDWVLICDLDELLNINATELQEEEEAGATIIRAEGYNMVDMENKLDIPGMRHGMRDAGHDKSHLFNKKFIDEINYSGGAHTCSPVGSVVYSLKAYKLYHYCYLNYAVTVARYKDYRARISPEDVLKGSDSWSETPEEIRTLYTEARKHAVKVR